jgi:NADH-quinone oxidoreductase subunit G
MPTCIIDGKTLEFKQGENLVEVAKRGGIEIPVFCYHPAMTVVAQCRMCAVEIEKMPKLQTACSTEAKEGMVVHTQSEKSDKNRKAIMEFLLINHPLDCPVCDKSGECDLQDNSFKHGSEHMRYTEERRTYLDLDMGPVIKKNMNRCIHCTRCIRFGDEIAGVREMVAVQRGNNTEITTLDGRALETDYAGNYADICPTGSLTIKDFRFTKRAWMLKKTPTICEGCSKGCNMEAHHEGAVVHRTVPRVNMEVNKYWLCDEGRFNFNNYQKEDRILSPTTGTGQALDWESALVQSRDSFSGGKKVSLLVGSDLTQEELQIILDFSKKALSGAPVYHFGTAGVSAISQDAPEDKILRRKSKTANLFGCEKLGIKPYSAEKGDVAIVFRGGRATLPDLSGFSLTIGVGVFFKPEIGKFKKVLSGHSFLEKEGTFFNFEGKEQKIKRAISPPRQTKAISEILMVWMNKGLGAA